MSTRRGAVPLKLVMPGRNPMGRPKSVVVFPPVSERKFQRQVVQYAALRGWHAYHTHDSRRSAAGFPDLVLVRERVVWAELKAAAGRVKPEQRAWAEWLRAAGQEAYLWRPENWAEIETILA